MKIHSRARWLALFAVLAIELGACGQPHPASPSVAAILGTARAFTVLAGSTVTNVGPTTIAGDVGVSPGLAITGFPPARSSGVLHRGDAVALAAQADVTTAYLALAALRCDHDITGRDLGGLTLTPGVYCFSSSAQLTGALTLDAQGDPSASFVFQITSTLTTASNASVLLINAAEPCNTYWQVGSSATLGSTTAFVGNILALSSITLVTGASVVGRTLARNGAVTMDSNRLAVGACSTATDAGVADGGVAGATCCVGIACGSTCVDVMADAQNCGACGNVCAASAHCADGVCVTCDAVCADTCADLTADATCGACGNWCAASEHCHGGACETCASLCGGACADLASDHDDCGVCGNVCGANEVCTAGACELCRTGPLCRGACMSYQSDPLNCGGCGAACELGATCVAGTCVARCAAPAR